MADTPKLFRMVLQVSDVDKAAAFYAKLLGEKGRRVHGSRHYLDCGKVMLVLLDPSQGGEKARPNPDILYFAVQRLATYFARARRLNCLSPERFHGQAAGEVVVRPWGERSFYVEDPFGNGLCFVDERTIFSGR